MVPWLDLAAGLKATSLKLSLHFEHEGSKADAAAVARAGAGQGPMGANDVMHLSFELPTMIIGPLCRLRIFSLILISLSGTGVLELKGNTQS